MDEKIHNYRTSRLQNKKPTLDEYQLMGVYKVL